MELLRAAAHVPSTPGLPSQGPAAELSHAPMLHRNGHTAMPASVDAQHEHCGEPPSQGVAELVIDGVRLSPKQEAYQLENDKSKFQERMRTHQITYWNQASTCSDNYLETTLTLKGPIPVEWRSLPYVNVVPALLDEKNKSIEGDDTFLIRSHEVTQQSVPNIIQLPLDAGPHTPPPSTPVRFHIKMCSQNCFKQRLKMRFEIDRRTPGCHLVQSVSTVGILVMSKINRRTEKRDRLLAASDNLLSPPSHGGGDATGAHGGGGKRMRPSKPDAVLDKLNIIENLLHRVLDENKYLRAQVAELNKSQEVYNPAYELLSMRHNHSSPSEHKAGGTAAVPPPPPPPPQPRAWKSWD